MITPIYIDKLSVTTEVVLADKSGETPYCLVQTSCQSSKA